VSDAFAGVLAAIRHGHGPRDNFRSYLLATVRNGCRLRLQRITVAEHGLRPDAGDRPVFENPERYVEADTVARAFASLSPRWQLTLWLTEVEQRPVAEVAARLDLAPNATAALAHRARQAFATARRAT
jgi:DNA-directed RNA polymerase specialized sigma24 family protein